MEENNVINFGELVRNMKTVPQEYKTSKELFAECANQQRFDLIVQFDNSLLTEDFINSNFFKIMSEMRKNIPENMKTNRLLFNNIFEHKIGIQLKMEYAAFFDGSLFNEELIKKYSEEIIDNIDRCECTPVSEFEFIPELRKSQVLLNKCIELNRFDLVINFDGSLLTDDFISRYLSEIMYALESMVDIPEGLLKSKILFEEYAKHKDNSLFLRNLEFFDGSVITEDFIKKNPDIVDRFLTKSSGSISRFFKNSKELLKECARRKRYDLFKEFHKDLFTEDFIEEYSELIMDNLKYNIPVEFKTSKVLFEKCIKQKKVDLLFQFDESLFTEKFLQDYSSFIISNLKGDIPQNFRNSKFLFDECAKQEKFVLLKQFDDSLFTEKFIANNLKFIMCNLADSLPRQLRFSRILFYTCFKQEKFYLLIQFDGTLLTEEFIRKNLSFFMTRLTDYLPDELKNSKVLFDRCCEEKKYDLLIQFDNELFTEEFIESNLDFIIDNLETENFPIAFTSSKNLFFGCFIRKKIEKFKGDFILNFFSDSFIKANLQLYIDCINYCGNVPALSTRSKVLFNEFLNKKMSNFLMQMDSSLFTYEILKNNYAYFSSILRSSNQYSFLLTKIPDFRKMILNNKDYDLLMFFPFDKNVLIDFEDGKEPQFNQDKLKWYSNLLNVSVGELTNKLKDLLKINDEILNTIHPFMLSQKMNCLSFKNLERLSVYPDLQFKLNQCSQKELMIINRILTYLDNDLDKSYDIITIIYYIINNWDCHRELLQTINSNELTNEELTNLIFILQRKNDFYPIKTVEELEPENFNKLTNQVFKDIEERTLNGNITIEELKRAIFERKYGLDLESVKFIIKRYCQDMEVIRNSDDISERNRIILQSINYIYNIDDLAKLSFLYLTSNKLPYGYSSFIDLDAQIREDYAKRYSNSLYKIKEEHRMKKEDFEMPGLYEKVSKIKYKGKKPRFYVLDGDFNLQIHVLGAYMDFDRPSNFKEDWERPKIAYHGIATSYIANNQIANARQYHPAYGFDSYDAEAMIAIQNSDIFSDRLISQFASSIYQPCCFYPPKEMIDKTRHTHNEFVLERRGDKGSSSYKRLPSYIVYMVDDINNEDNFDIENNELFDESVQAAIDNDIPIVIVDRLKYAKSEKKKYETLLDKFVKQPNLFDMKNILLIVCDNMIGCAKYESQPDMDYHTYFNEDVLTDVIDKIIDVIEKQSEPNRQYLIIELYKHSLKEPLITGGNQRKINQLYSNLNLKINIFQESQKDLRKVRQYYDNASEEIKEAIALDIDHGLSYEYIYFKILNGEYYHKEKSLK